MSVYTSLRSSSNSLYGSIEDSESVSVSCKVVKRRQWFLWWSDLIRFNCFWGEKKKISWFLISWCISKKWLVNIFGHAHLLEEMYSNANTHFLWSYDRFSITHACILSILQAFGPLVIDLGMWDTAEIHIINRIKISFPGGLKGSHTNWFIPILSLRI